MIEKLNHIRNLLETFFKTDAGKITARIFRYCVHALIIGILIYQIWNLGISSVLQELPTHPLFYLLFLLIYFSLPIAEYFTYSRSFKLNFLSSQAIFLKKRIYNKTIIGYSGELQLFFWLKKEFDIPEKESFKVVRDNNTLSTIASTFVTVTLLVGFFLTGNITMLEFTDIQIGYYLAALGVGVLIIALVFMKFKKYLYSMNRRDTLSIFGIHSLRLYLLAVFQVLQWAVVMPEVSYQIWITIIAMQIILSRLPFIPNKDLIFIAASLEYSQHVDISAAALAGLLIVNHLLDKLMNAAAYAWLSWRGE